ncbi:MAG: NAD(P)-dependent oxidoreductase [Polyangiales bacterium]
MVIGAKMRLFVLGATGGIGRALIEQSLQRGHTVTAFVRSPEKLGVIGKGVVVRKGDPRNEAELRAALAGHDAVLSALGPPGIGHTTIHRDCARSTIAAMETTHVRRLLVVSAAVLFDDIGLLPWLFRRTILRNIAEDTGEMERLVRATDLDWTIARPPRLTNGRLGRYAVEDEAMPRGGSTVSRADVAHFMLEALERNTHVRHMVGMASA